MTWTLIKEILSVTADVVTVLGIPSLVYGIFKSLRSRKAKLVMKMVKSDRRFQTAELINIGAGEAHNICVHYLHGVEPTESQHYDLPAGQSLQLSFCTQKQLIAGTVYKCRVEISWRDGMGYHIKKQDLIIN